MTRHAAPFYPKDMLETVEGLLFAVVAYGLENDKALCFLRYVKEASGWKKYPTEAANSYLLSHYPDYLHYSEPLAAHLHAVPVANIRQHHQPRQRLQSLLQQPGPDAVEQDMARLLHLLHSNGLNLAHMGVTGSVLAGVHNPSSDIDLVCYDRAVFQQCRAVVRQLVTQGELDDLAEADWQAAYQRRAADLSYRDYVWHERRKHNKALVNGRKFDLSLLNVPTQAHTNGQAEQNGLCQKIGPASLQCVITDDSQAFDYPISFHTDHASIPTIICFTATYAGQAFKGERVEASGVLEQTPEGLQRLVVGSSREATGEYIKVIRT